ncbi:MAG: single-stranded-DNA-specific exonuclease RecJ [Candidatus Sedimenticola sp. (ex Thyasira tokunagai)]
MTIAIKQIIRSPLPDTSTELPDTLHPVLRRAYAIRNLTSRQDLDLDLGGMLPPAELGGTEAAAELLFKTLDRGGRILIVADFDADGATSCALAVRALKAMGAKVVDYLVPNRFEYGYGLTPKIVVEAMKREPNLLVTVDNGISSVEGVAVAKAAGMEVLVTDHHLPGRQLPEADVIVNPNAQGETFASKNLAGVGVIFYVMVALRAMLRRNGWFERQQLKEPNLADYLDLVALGTVADVVPLDHNNRILVQQGLQRIRSGYSCAGVKALFERAGRNAKRVVTSDLGFAIGPRLNAAGRLDDMSLGIESLLCDDPGTAYSLARELDELNSERRTIENEMKQQATELLQHLSLEDDLPFGLVLYQTEWHQGVVGILAARIKERYHRPVIAFALAETGVIKGSARSIPGLHIRDTLDAVATGNPGLLEKFGGHAMAAGLTIALDSLDEFSKQFDHEVRKRIDSEALRERICSDGGLAAGDLTMDLAQQLRAGGPWGQGFPEPLFDGWFKVIKQRVVGKHHLKLVLQPEEGGVLLDAIAFNQAEIPSAKERDKIHAAYRLDINEFRGARNLQLIIEHLDDK